MRKEVSSDQPLVSLPLPKPDRNVRRQAASTNVSWSNYVVRILSTLDRELLKPSSSVALHRHSNALVDILPPEADSSISMLGADEKPDIKYSDVGGLDSQKQEIREAVELPLEQVRAGTVSML